MELDPVIPGLLRPQGGLYEGLLHVQDLLDTHFMGYSSRPGGHGRGSDGLPAFRVGADPHMIQLDQRDNAVIAACRGDGLMALDLFVLPESQMVFAKPAAGKDGGGFYADEADAAVINLFDQASNTWNIPYVRNLAPGSSVVVLRLFGRTQGLIVQERNPKRITTWGGLLREGVRLSNRTKGSGSRVLLDEKLRALEARSETIEGYSSQAYVGTTAIRRVSNGLADVAIGHEREAKHVKGVQFVPLQPEWVDIVIKKTPKTRPVIRKINDLLADDHVRHEFASLSPCDISKLGVVVYES